MQVIHDATAETLEAFVMASVAPGVVGHTDGWMGYARLLKKGYAHRPRSQRAAKREVNPAPIMPRVHRAISNFKFGLRGTNRSVSTEHRQDYLDEFTFRHYRRATPMVSVQPLLGLESHHDPTILRQITNEGTKREKASLSYPDTHYGTYVAST